MKVILDLKAVMDTNVFISGVFFSGLPYKIRQAWPLGESEDGTLPGGQSRHPKGIQISHCPCH